MSIETTVMRECIDTLLGIDINTQEGLKGLARLIEVERSLPLESLPEFYQRLSDATYGEAA